ncbi:TPA: SIR2 family protein, partial [Streptococcus suis]|nr:SIR2 family protein [Streptococcus suis]
KLEGTNATISVEKLRVDILKLKYEDIDIRGIFKYTKFFVNFFEFLSVETQGDIFEFFAKYEEEDSIEIRYHEIIELMLSEIFDFSKIQKDVYTYLMGRINAEESATKSYPDPLKTSLSDLFNLKNKGYFAEISITDMIQDIKKDIKGIFPEVDWKWFNDRSDRVMKRLLEHRTPSDIKKYYATTEEDKERLNSLIVRLLDERKIEFNNR